MTCWAIIPIKALREAKHRLSGVLEQDARERLVEAMLRHVVDAALQASKIDRIALVGPSRHGLPDDIALLRDPGEGYNAAVQSALAEIAAESPTRVIVIAADLPGVSPLDLDLLAIAPADKLAIAPDRHGTGTNAISLPMPAGAQFSFAFGPDSHARHRQEAERLGLDVETILSHGLEKDVDLPEDLPDAEQVIKESG